MPLTDDKHRVAKKIKDHDQRLSDLEQQSRSTEEPNILVTLEDDIGIGDDIESVTEYEMQAGAWGSTGWKTSSWGAYDRV